MRIADREDYKKYLLTDEWKKRANARIKFAKWRCEVCNSDGGLQAHHRTYANRGNETLEDLVCLCEECHNLYHHHEVIRVENKNMGLLVMAIKGWIKQNACQMMLRSFAKLEDDVIAPLFLVRETKEEYLDNHKA